MSTLINLNDEVEINQSDFIAIDQTWIERIKAIAKNNGSGKYRTCIHQSEKDDVHVLYFPEPLFFAIALILSIQVWSIAMKSD
jgi:hypothetical protein